MYLVNKFFNNNITSSTTPNSQNKIPKLAEDSTLLKVFAACIPFFGFFISAVQTNSINRKLRKLPLPEEVRPHPIFGQILPPNSPKQVVKLNCETALELHSVKHDYHKSTSVNYLLTLAIAICVCVKNSFPRIVSGSIIGCYALASLVSIGALYLDYIYLDYIGENLKKMIANNK